MGYARRRRAGYPDWAVGMGIFVGVGVLLALVILMGSNDRHRRRGTPYDFGYERVGRYRPVSSAKYARAPGQSFLRVLPAEDIAWLVLGAHSPVAHVALALKSAEQAGLAGRPAHEEVSAALPYFMQFLAHDLAWRMDNTSAPRVGGGGGWPGVFPSVANPRRPSEQLTFSTPPLDASAVYGSDPAVTRELRRRDGSGKLRTTHSPHHTEPLLPTENGRYRSGDPRVTEHVFTSGMRLLFHRVHNQFAKELRRDNPGWDEKQLFYMAREITMGCVQSIAYNEVLPLLLGRTRYNDFLAPDSAAYRRHTRAGVFNEFATAAFALWRLLVPDGMEARSPQTGARTPALDLTFAEATEGPSVGGALWTGGADAYLLGAAKQPARQLSFVSAPFQLPEAGIARGRDHGLPSYQHLYEAVMGEPLVSHTQISSVPSVRSALGAAYGPCCGTPIDLMVGLLAEDRLPGALFGEVGAYLLELQWAFLRDTDPYFYIWNPTLRPYLGRIKWFRFADALALGTGIDTGVLDRLGSPFLA